MSFLFIILSLLFCFAVTILYSILHNQTSLDKKTDDDMQEIYISKHRRKRKS